MERKLELLKGMSPLEFATATQAQIKDLPRPAVIPKSDQKIAERFGYLLYKCEERRVKVRTQQSVHEGRACGLSVCL